jgi:hypothetical protein
MISDVALITSVLSLLLRKCFVFFHGDMGVYVGKHNPRPAPGNIGGCYLAGKYEKRKM